MILTLLYHGTGKEFRPPPLPIQSVGEKFGPPFQIFKENVNFIHLFSPYNFDPLFQHPQTFESADPRDLCTETAL